MSYSVDIDLTKKIIFNQNDKYYVRFEAKINENETNIQETHHKCLFVTDDLNMSWGEVDRLANQVIINFKLSLEEAK
jgi:hypothetical protein